MPGVNLSREQIQRADAIANELTERFGVSVSRSAAIGKAIDAFFLANCPIDNPKNLEIGQEKEQGDD